MNTDDAYRICRETTRAAARNFYYAFVLLPEPRRSAIYALYAFARRADDSVDDAPGPERAEHDLNDRRAEIATIYGGEPGQDPVLVALADAVRRFAIPREHLDDLLDGMEMDIATTRYDTYADLELYCDRVAAAPGLASLHIFGFSDPDAPRLARELGIAMQLVNVLRDVAEDAERDRIYIPREALAAHGATEEDVLGGRLTTELRRVFEAHAATARQAFATAQPLGGLLDRRARSCVTMLGTTYRAILDEIERAGFDVFGSRARLSTPRKLRLMSGSVVAGWTS